MSEAIAATRVPADESITAALGRIFPVESRKASSRLIGALFLLGFIFYGVGFGALAAPALAAPDLLVTIVRSPTTLVLGCFLMLLNSLVDIGKGVLFFPILESRGKRTALVYLAALIVEVVLLDIGVLFLLMLVPLAQSAPDAGGAAATWATALSSTLIQGNLIAYNVAQATLGFGGIFLCALLFRTKLVPQWLSGLGFVGYAVHMIGSVGDLFGLHLSTVLLIPGALFEVSIAFWLIIVGVSAVMDRETRAA